MPLGEIQGWEKSSSKFCGLETDFSADVPSLLSSNIDNGRFDFVLAPLMDPSYRPSKWNSQVLPFACSDLVLTPEQWRTRVVGKISSWIDLDSEDETLRIDSETTLKQEISWADHLSLRACLLPTPSGLSCENYARCVNQILKKNTEIELWLRIPLMKSHGTRLLVSYSRDPEDMWNIWNWFRVFCDHDRKLCVALDDMSTLPSQSSIERWFGEPVKAAIISTRCFLPNAQGHAHLLKSHQELITRFFHHSVQVIVSGTPQHRPQRDSVNMPLKLNLRFDGMQKQTYNYKQYLDCFSRVFRSMEPLSEQERIVFSFRDRLNSPLQPLKENLDAESYDTFERDTAKYIQYQRAIAKALIAKVPREKASQLTTVLMVVGAGRGGLVRASLQAAEETGRKLKVYAVEKNPNAVITINDLVKARGWEGTVTVVSCDMRFWNAPERADILVSEMLGCFGDNDLSPECLDRAQRFLKPDGISIPFSYTSFIQPITASKLYNDVKGHNDLSHYETAYVVKLHSVARLASTQPVFTFTHPNFSRTHDNQCYKKLRFDLPGDMGSAMVHGFAGYFIAQLYDDVYVSNEPSTATPNMFGWFPMFFPLRKPVEVNSGSPIELHIWTCSESKKVWYEWSVSSPTVSAIHNTNGSSYWISL